MKETKMNMETVNKEELSLKVKEIVIKSGLSYRKFVQKADISLATLTNILNPSYTKLPSPTVLRKIALMSKEPERNYNMLMELCNYDISNYPFSQPSSMLESEYSRILLPRLLANPSIKLDKIFELQNPFDFIFSVSDNEFCNTWKIEIHSFILHSIDEFILNCLKDVNGQQTKYSLITNNPKIIDLFRDFNFSKFNAYLSIICLTPGDILTETVIPTALDSSGIESINI